MIIIVIIISSSIVIGINIAIRPTYYIFLLPKQGMVKSRFDDNLNHHSYILTCF